jgi:hypothetical protein
MENTKGPVDLSTLSDADFEAEMLRRNSEKAELQQKAKQDYENLKSEVVTELCKSAKEINETLEKFKIKAFSDMQTVYDLLKEYSSRHKDGKGNFKIEYQNYRVSYKRQGKPHFDERSHQAEKHIIDFVNSKFNNDKDTRDLVMSLLERKKDQLDINLIQKLYAMENRFQDENWKRGIELLKESYSYSHSKDYIGFEFKDDKGEWQTINLQFSNI